MSEQNQPEKQEKKPEKKNFQHRMALPGKKGIIYTIARGIFWIYFHLFCFMHCTGREKLNLDAPYIVIANHTSFADPIIAAMLIRRYEVNFLGKIELAKAPVVGKLLMHLHMIPVDRHHSDMEAMRAREYTSMPASSRIRAISLPRRMTERVSSCVRSSPEGRMISSGSGMPSV